MTPFDQLTLKTPRLLLRPLAPADADALFAIFSDPAVMRYWSTPPWTSIERAHQMIAYDLTALPAGEQLRLGITLHERDEIIGTCTLFDFHAQCRRAEIGYALGSPAWGNGYMHEALTALLDFGFMELDFNRVEADIDPRNLASGKCLERLGFQREGLLRERWIVDGEISDTSLYGLLKRDWVASGRG
jgi:RimJ/RimL family protein N-acetyltransferase